MIEKINYTDKESLIDDSSIPNKNKVMYLDMNEIKSVVNNNADILSEQIESFKENLATTTGTGENVTLDKTAEMEFVNPPLPEGNTFQDGTPTPENEVPIQNVTGDVEVLISNRDNTESQTFTFPLGSERSMLGDYLADDGIHSKKIRLSFDETTGITQTQSYSDVFYINIDSAYNNSVIPYSNMFKGISYITGASDMNSKENNSLALLDLNYNRIYIKTNKFANANEFKAFLENNPLIVEIEGTTETVTPYTEPQQAVYDEIKQAISYYEQTNISGSSDEANPIFDVEAYQSTKLILESLS